MQIYKLWIKKQAFLLKSNKKILDFKSYKIIQLVYALKKTSHNIKTIILKKETKNKKETPYIVFMFNLHREMKKKLFKEIKKIYS